MSLQVKIKKLHKNAIIPSYAKEGDAAMDITATEVNYDNQYVSYKTGIAIEIPEGFVGLLFPRSSVQSTGLRLTNGVGVIDSGYRGEIQSTFKKMHGGEQMYKIGDRAAQIMIIAYPNIDFVETNNLSDTERGSGGFGSTGN